MTKSFDVFLSHNSKDKPAVRELAEALRARGLNVWLDEWELVPGRPWQVALEKTIETIGSSAVLVGKDGLGPWQDREMRGCLNEFARRELPVIPVLLPGAPEAPKLPIFLNEFTWVDLRGGLTEEGIDRLQWGITGKRPDRSKLPSNAGPEGATKTTLAEAQMAPAEVSVAPEVEKSAVVAQDQPVLPAQAPESESPWSLRYGRSEEASLAETEHFWVKIKRRRATLSLVPILILFLFIVEKKDLGITPKNTTNPEEVGGNLDSGARSPDYAKDSKLNTQGNLNFTIALSGLVALVPINDSAGANHMTALLLAARPDPATKVECLSPYRPSIQLETSAAECREAGCSVSSSSKCTCELDRQEVSIGPDVEPPQQLLTKRPSSILPNKESAGDFAYIANLAQPPFGQTLNPQYLGASPPPNLVARMTFPFESITACAMSASVNEAPDRVLPMGFGWHAKKDLMVQAVAQAAVAMFKPAYSVTTVTIRKFDEKNAYHLKVRSEVLLTNAPMTLSPEDTCAKDVSQDFAFFYDLALNPPLWQDRLIPRLRYAQGSAENFKILQCPFDQGMKFPIIPMATFNP